MNKPRPFNHLPIYTDARRERLQQVEQRARQELGLAPASSYVPSNLRGAFSAKQKEHRKGRGLLLWSLPMLLAVTQLTSTSEERMQKELLISASMPDTVRHYAKNAREAGLDGVVCSPLEAALVKDACGPDFAAVTPGIRFADSAADDQRRVMTPAKARLGGSDYIVVGRPITRAADPVAAYRRCVREFLGTE